MKTRAYRPDVDAPTWRGGYYPYDILKEGTIALLVVLILTVTLAVVFGSPDEKSITIKAWSTAAPVDFAQTAFGELDGTSTSAGYGAPDNTASTGQQLGPLQLAKWVGVRIPINSARDFVLNPLASQPDLPTLSAALATYRQASSAQRSAWLAAYAKGEGTMAFTNGAITISAPGAGPVPVLVRDITAMARSGALDESLLSGNAFYTTNYTKSLLFISDGGYLAQLAQHQHLLGTQWGMMNETGSYPGQAWLWLYTFWYQIPPFSTSTNADVLVWGTMMLLSAVLLFLPFIPGLRSIPRRLKIYRLIWREHYRSQH